MKKKNLPGIRILVPLEPDGLFILRLMNRAFPQKGKKTTENEKKPET